MRVRAGVLALLIAASGGLVACDLGSLGGEPGRSWSMEEDGLEVLDRGRVGPDGLVLDGYGSHARADDVPVTTDGSLTVMAWVRPRQLAPYAAAVSLLGEEAAAVSLGYGENVWALSVRSSDDARSVTTRVVSGYVEPGETWTHLAGVLDAERGLAFLYVNGARARMEGVRVDRPFPADGPLVVGSTLVHGELGAFWRGTVRDVRVYPSALSPGEITDVVVPGAPPGTSLAVPRAPRGPVCPNGDGGACLGELVAGTYVSREFEPALLYAVPSGWVNDEDLPGNFRLRRVDDVRFVGVYRHVAVPYRCSELPDLLVGRSAPEIARWLTGHPGLATTEPRPVRLGGLDGVFLDIELDPGWTGTCPAGVQPAVPFLVGTGESWLHHTVVPGLRLRLYLLDLGGLAVAVEVNAGGGSLGPYLDEALPVVDTFRFARWTQAAGTGAADRPVPQPHKLRGPMSMPISPAIRGMSW